MEELDCAFGAITETWFSTNAAFSDDLDDVRARTGLGVLCKNRPPNALGVSHGGVAIVYNENKCTFSEVSLKNDQSWEVLVGCGRFIGFNRPVIAVACYIPPNYTAQRGLLVWHT